MKEDHQQAIKEKDAAVALLNDDLQNLEYDNVALQAQKDVYQAQLQRCQDQIYDLIINRYGPRANDPRNNIIIIIKKNTTPEEDGFHEYPAILREYSDGSLAQKDDGLLHNVHIIDL